MAGSLPSQRGLGVFSAMGAAKGPWPGCLRQYLDAAKAETDGMNSNGFMDGLMVRQLDGEFIGAIISANKSNFCLESSSPVSLSPSLPLNWSNTGGARVYARHRDTEVY